MTTISLTPEQVAALREVLIGYHNTLLLELAHADSRDFREMLRSRETMITDVLGLLAQTAHAA